MALVTYLLAQPGWHGCASGELAIVEAVWKVQGLDTKL